MDTFESLENLSVSEECFDDIVSIVEEYINETSDERAHAASVETTKRYNNARNAVIGTESMLKAGKDFYSKGEIKELKKQLKQQKADFEEAKRKRVRDNRNQFNRDKRLGRVPDMNDIKEALETLILEFDEAKKVATIKKRIDNLVAATKAAKESNDAFPKGGSIEDQKANLLQTAGLKKKQEEAAKKLNRSTALGGRNIKDPANRKEIMDYARKNM